MSAAAGSRIKVANPVVDLDGDEMTRSVSLSMPLEWEIGRVGDMFRNVSRSD